MSAVIDTALQAITPSELLVAAIGGYFAGNLIVADVVRDYGLPLAAAAFARMLVATALFYVGIFYLGQVVASILDGDPGWPRIAGRFVDFLLFAGCSGIGLYRGLRHTH